MGLLTREQMTELGFAHVGEDVRLSDRASYYGCERISIGDHSRIDDFCVLSAGEGGIAIGQYVHVAVHSSLIGHAPIELSDFSGISTHCAVYSSNDDYSGAAMTNPTVPPQFTNVHHAAVHFGRHTILGTGSVVLPGITLHEGAAVGALSIVVRDCESFGIYAGRPARRIKTRERGLLDHESHLMARAGRHNISN